VLADKYRLEQELGRGAMGAVFRARHLVTGKQVAIKCQLPSEQEHPDDMARFLAEARAAAAITHPNIVDVYDVGEADGALYLVMELLDGVPLRALLGRGPLPLGPAVRTMVDVMRGIAAAHRSGVVHRDLKPENVLLQRAVDDAAQGPKVLDFGIAKLRAAGDGDSGHSAPSLTTTGAVIGTPHYMSPEQAEASQHVDARADIYALGVMLYELLAGVRPYQANSATAVLLRAARGEHTPLRSLRPDVPPALANAIATAMAPRADDRFDRVGAFIDAIQPFAAAQGLEPGTAASEIRDGISTPLAVESLRSTRRRRLLGVPVSWLLLLAVAIALGLSYLRASRRPDDVVSTPPTEPATAVTTPSSSASQRPAAEPAPPDPPPPSADAVETPAPRPAVGGAKPRRNVPSRASSSPAPEPTTAPERRGRLGVGFGRDEF